jgi:hypothetical protein
MANWIFKVVDQNGIPIANAGVNVQVDTSPCPGWPYTGSCTTGPGYQIVGSTDANGIYASTISYTCPQEVHNVGTTPAITAPGGFLNQADFSYNSGDITGDVYLPTIILDSDPGTQNGGQGVASFWTAFVDWWQGSFEGFTTWIGNYWWLPILLVVAAVIILVAWFYFGAQTAAANAAGAVAGMGR